MVIKVENGAGFNSKDERDPKSSGGIQFFRVHTFAGKTKDGNSEIDII